MTRRRKDDRRVTKNGTDVEGKSVELSRIDGRGSWKAQEGFSVLEVVYGGNRLYALRISSFTSHNDLAYRLLQMTLKEQLTN